MRVASLPHLLLAAVCITRGPSTWASSEHAAARADRPNIILFLVDDLGQQDVSVPMLAEPSALNARFRTPNLERLAARGVRFSNAYAAAPVCTPSRTAILSGQSPARTRITYWTLEKDTDQSSAHPRLAPPRWNMNGLQPSPDLLPARLRDAGYATIHVGKAHFGARGTAGADPCALGFETNIAGHGAGAPGSFRGSDHFKSNAARQRGKADPATVEPTVWDVPGLARWHGTETWLDDALAREACDALDAAVASARPFYLSFCPYGVHAPIMEDARFAAAYAALDPTERAYATMVAAVDDALGKLVAKCEALGVLDQTVIVFTSDNGGLSAHARGAAPDGTKAHGHNAPLRSGKGSAYEGGLRVPLVVSGPGIAHRETPEDAPVVGTDLYPTVLSFAGLAPSAGRVCDGIDLRPLLVEGTAPRERAIVFHQPHAWGPKGPGIEPFTALRLGAWKLIWFHDEGRGAPVLELYDVARDPA
ncbi:MAG: sulfatase-like hydrolase/transferase, partial [Phycisphaerales bacterium]